MISEPGHTFDRKNDNASSSSCRVADSGAAAPLASQASPRGITSIFSLQQQEAKAKEGASRRSGRVIDTINLFFVLFPRSPSPASLGDPPGRGLGRARPFHAPVRGPEGSFRHPRERARGRGGPGLLLSRPPRRRSGRMRRRRRRKEREHEDSPGCRALLWLPLLPRPGGLPGHPGDPETRRRGDLSLPDKHRHPGDGQGLLGAHGLPPGEAAGRPGDADLRRPGPGEGPRRGALFPQDPPGPRQEGVDGRGQGGPGRGPWEVEGFPAAAGAEGRGVPGRGVCVRFEKRRGGGEGGGRLCCCCYRRRVRLGQAGQGDGGPRAGRGAA